MTFLRIPQRWALLAAGTGQLACRSVKLKFKELLGDKLRQLRQKVYVNRTSPEKAAAGLQSTAARARRRRNMLADGRDRLLTKLVTKGRKLPKRGRPPSNAFDRMKF